VPEPVDHGDRSAADRHHLARGAVINLIVLVTGNLRGVFTFLVARLLGEAALGRFGLAWAATELLSKIGMLGLDSGIVPVVATRAGVGDTDGARAILRRAIALVVIVSAVVALAAWLTSVWLVEVRGLDALTDGGALMMFALPGIAAARVATGASRAVMALGNEIYSRGLADTWVTIGVFLIVVAAGVGDTAPSLAVVAGSTAGGLVACVLAVRALAAGGVPGTGAMPQRPDEAIRPPALTTGSRRPSMRSVVAFSLPIAGSSVLAVLATRLDVLLLGTFVGRAPGLTLESFGVYCAATEIAVGLRKVRQVFDPILGPVAVHAAVDRARLRQAVAAPGRWVVSVQLPLVGLLLLSGGAILTIYGRAFREGALWLGILAIAHGANSFVGLVETLLMVERPRLNLISAVVTLVVQVAAGLLLIPRWGATGAAVAIGAGLVVQGALRFRDVRSVFGWSWPWPSLRRPVAIGALAFAPALATRVALAGRPGVEIASGVLFLALYAAGWYRIGPEPSDRDVWRRLTASWRRA
jgi:O-antigen/teichoic acid export membrane protein